MQRTGDTDHNDASDWEFLTTKSPAIWNDGLVLPVSWRTGIELFSSATTHYFRTEFDFSYPIDQTELSLNLAVDDGAVLYLNGQEVYRQNMPDGPIGYDTLATADVGIPTFTNDIRLPVDSLLQGTNVLAMEVHQAVAGQSDMYFYAEVIATVWPPELANIHLALNEVSPAGPSPFWLELVNYDMGPIDIGGYVIATSAGDEYVLPSEDIAVAELLKLREKYGSDRLVFETIKIHYDGVHEILTAGMLEPYETDPGNRGGVLVDSERLTKFIGELNEEGIDLHLHTVGDRADARGVGRGGAGAPRPRRPGHRSRRCPTWRPCPPKTSRASKSLGVHANFTPHWFGGRVFGTAGCAQSGSRSGPSRSQVAGELLRAGANVTLSSDVVSEAESYRAAPFLGLQMSVTRREYDDPSGSVLSPASAQTTSRGGHRGLHAERCAPTRSSQTGWALSSLSKRADFLVLDRSPFEVPIHELHELVPRSVVVGGVVESGSL